MKRYLRKTHIVVQNKTGLVKIIPQVNGKKQKTDNDKKDSEAETHINFSPSEINLQSASTSCNYSLICLSGAIDDCQVFVYIENKQYFLVYIKKAYFQNREAFISSCTCDNSDNFLVLNDTAAQYIYDVYEVKLIKCKHIRACVHNILDKFNCEMQNELKVQDDLIQYCSINLYRSNYFNRDHTICGALCNSDGLILFIKKNKKWKCVACNWQDSIKCRHGFLLDIDSPEPENPFSNNSVNTTEHQSHHTTAQFEVLSKKKFSGNVKIYTF